MTVRTPVVPRRVTISEIRHPYLTRTRALSFHADTRQTLVLLNGTLGRYLGLGPFPGQH